MGKWNHIWRRKCSTNTIKYTQENKNTIKVYFLFIKNVWPRAGLSPSSLSTGSSLCQTHNESWTNFILIHWRTRGWDFVPENEAFPTQRPFLMPLIVALPPPRWRYDPNCERRQRNKGNHSFSLSLSLSLSHSLSLSLLTFSLSLSLSLSLLILSRVDDFRRRLFYSFFFSSPR